MSFDFTALNTRAGGSGLQGPFINWQSRTGERAQGQTWTLTSMIDNNERVTADITENFKAGVIFDYNSIKLGWEKWAPLGQQSEVVWAPGFDLQKFPRPEDTKRKNEMGRDVFLWQKTFAIRIALNATTAGTWNQASFGAMRGFEIFVEALKAQGPQHPGMLPLVQFTGIEEEYGGAKVPVLSIGDWRAAPDCLKTDTGAAAINTGAPTAPAPAAPVAQPAPQPAPVAVEPAPAPAAPTAPALQPGF